MKRSRKYYGIWCLVLLLVEISIAVYIDDDFIRPFIGDVLVVVLGYSFLSWLHLLVNSPKWRMTLLQRVSLMLLFAYGIELLQFMQITQKVGLPQYEWIQIVLGTTYDWKDLLA